MVITGNSSVVWVSNNGGTNWVQRLLPAIPNSSGSAAVYGVSYANGRFFVSVYTYNSSSPQSNGDMVISTDLNNWNYVQGLGPIGSPVNVAYVGSVNYILTVNSTATTVISATENTAQMYLPVTRRPFSVANVNLISVANYQEWIKVQ